MLYSPINYQGNKSRIANELLKLIPDDVSEIHEIFCGSAIISFSSNIKNVYLNDINFYIIQLLKYFQENSAEQIIKNTDSIISMYGLTNTYYEGKSKYIENKHEGLSKYNKEAFNKLKHDYNIDKSIEKLFVLIIYGFNHYLRFNNADEFNVPVGKIDFVKTLRQKTVEYCNAIHSKNIYFTNLDFKEKKLYEYDKKAFFYFDPPYLITMTTYNNLWNDNDEKQLLNKLDELNKQGYRFMLSNVIKSNGKENLLLKKWMSKYNVHYVNRQYLNSSYQKKNITKAIEVVITNY